jgi:hypothetical protein
MQYIRCMRTTLDIDEDVLSAAKELAAAENKTAGQIISELARKTLLGAASEQEPAYRNGFRLLPRTGKIITTEFIEKLLEEDL